MEYYLRQIDPGNPSPLLISLDEDVVEIGRSTVISMNQHIMKYKRVSRHHATFTKENDSWFITDHKSMNFLYVNFERIHNTVKLNIGDIIGLGTPNITQQDGGFVCVLAVRNTISVKLEPSDDECVEIPNNCNNILSRNSSGNINEPSIIECIPSQHIYSETDESKMLNIDSKTKNGGSISSEQPDLKIVKTESCFDLHRRVNVQPKYQACLVQPTLNFVENTANEAVDLNSIESGTVSTPVKLICVSPVSNISDIASTRVEDDNASSGDIISKSITPQNSGFVCALANRNKIKLEPSDDECVEIPTNCNDIPSRNSSGFINEPSILDCIPSQLIYNENNTKQSVNLNSIECGTVPTPVQLICVNPVSNMSDITNTRIENDNASSGEVISKSMEHNHAHNLLPPIRTNTQSSLAYPGIKYIEGLEKFISCGIITSNDISQTTDLDKCGKSNTNVLSNLNPFQSSNIQAHLNSSNVKQCYPGEFITDLSDNIKVENNSLQGILETSKNCIKPIHLATFQKCESISELDVKKSIVIKTHLPKDCTRHIFKTDNIQLPNDSVTSKINSDSTLIVPSQSLDTDSFSDKTIKIPIATNKILSSQEYCNFVKNEKDEGYSKEITESTKFLTKNWLSHTLSQNRKIVPIDNEVTATTPTQLKTSLSTQKAPKSAECLPKTFSTSSTLQHTQDCNIQAKCIPKKTKLSVIAAETSSPNICPTNKDNFSKNSSELVSVSKELFKLNNKTTKSNKNNLTVAINLKVRKNKILSSDSESEEARSESEERNEISFPPPQPSFTLSRHEQITEKPYEENPASKHSKAKRSKTRKLCLSPCSDTAYSQFNVPKEMDKAKKAPISSSFIRSKRRYSWSDCSDEYYRSRSPSADENRTQDTKSKSLGRTLIDSKPMEYRSRKLRGREEWFQERKSAQTLKPRSPCRKGLHRKEKAKKEQRESKYLSKKSKEAYSKKPKAITEKTAKEETPKNTLKDSAIRKKTMLPVPKRTTNFCSRMGFLIDTQGKCDAKSINKDKQQAKHRGIVSSKNELQLDLSLELELSSNKEIPTDKINSVRNKFTKTSTISEVEPSFIEIQYPVSNFKEHPQIHTTKKYDTRVPNFELNSKRKHDGQSNTCQESSLPDQISDSSISKTARRESFLIKDSPNSKKEDIETLYHPIDSTNCRRSARIMKQNQASSQIPSNKHVSENSIPILELDSKRKYDVQSYTCEKSSLSNHFSDPNMKTTTKESFQFEDSPNSEKEAIPSPSHQIVEDSTIDRRRARIFKQYQTSSTLLMEMIVSWNPKWLVEQKKIKNPPPLIAKGASHLNISFSSYDSYSASYFPMLVLEVWECLFRACSQHLVSEHLENCNKFSYTILECENKQRWTELKCASIVSDILRYHPTEGKVVLLNVKEKQEGALENYTFGCIRRHTVEEFKQDVPEWNTIPKEGLNNAKLVKFEVVVKKNIRPDQLNYVYHGHVLPNIQQKLQMADALRSFRYSPLCESIYHPREETLMYCDSSRKTLSWDNLNHALSEEVQNPISNARVLLLQTPPGTGKTKCVVELVKKLTSGNSNKCKVLVCAPSYSSLDEILCGLVQSNDNCNNPPSEDLMKLVVIGEDEGMSGKLKEYSLTKQVEKVYKEDCVKKMHSRESSLKLLEEKINNILFKQQTSQDMYTKVNKSTTLKALVDKMQNLRGKNLLQHMNEGIRRGYECIILRESDVMLSILDCSMLPAVKTFLKSESAAYCIVDKAAQCSELQLLQCLHEKIEKLILFGDPQQQKPCAISKCSAKYGFGRSIFERFFDHFKKKFHKIPCPAFKKQYRMHSEICRFPSKYFYNQELSTAEGTDERYANFPLKPYTVIDVLDGPIPEETESSLIMYICSELVQSCPTATIGVILAGEEQKYGITLPSDPEYASVEIDTLEKFQGKEKDIILIPCIPQFSLLDKKSIISCGEMLNVALTRAKQCLIICGPVASNMQYPHWKALREDALARYCYLCVTSVKHIPLLFTNYIKKPL